MDNAEPAQTDLNERLARAMCARDGWKDADQTAYVTDGPDGPQRIRRWQAYLKRVEMALGAFADVGIVYVRPDTDRDTWRLAAAAAYPEHPLGSYDNRLAAEHAEHVVAALAALQRDA